MTNDDQTVYTSLIWKPCTIIYFQQEPYLFNSAKKGESPEYHGYIKDLLDKLSRDAEFTYEFLPTPDGEFGRQAENGTWTGTIQQLLSGVCTILLSSPNFNFFVVLWYNVIICSNYLYRAAPFERSIIIIIIIIIIVFETKYHSVTIWKCFRLTCMVRKNTRIILICVWSGQSMAEINIKL